MTNYPFKSIDECRDIEILNAHKELVGGGRMSEEDLMDGIRAKGRDNARTPMQWDDTKEAGFTTGKPWIGVNPNYEIINAKAELEDKNSVFYYYQKLIELRTYQLLDKEDENIFAYT